MDSADSASNDAATSVRRVSQPLSRYGFSFTDFLVRDFHFGLDPGRPLCKAFQEGHCPDREKGKCYDIHPMSRSFNNLVCKHWLRGLCKKGDQCEFLHEYNLRRMPECNHFTRSLTCPNSDCLFVHIDPATKLTPCPHYEKGFCPLGARCSKKHVRKILCKYYLAGFCPYGRKCKEGAHPRFPTKLPKPTIKIEKTPEEIETERRQREEAMREEKQREWDRRDGNLGDGRDNNQRDGRDNNRREGRGRGKGRYGNRRHDR